MSQEVRWIAVGRISRAHGVKGEVAVLSLSQIESRFESGATLYLGQGERAVTVVASRQHRNRLLVSFQEIDDRDQAEALGGQYLFVPTSSAPQLPEGEYWPHELMGSTVVTTEGRTIGEIEEIIHTPANDVWVARAEGREVLIPALKDVVESVDVHARRVVVRELPGLTVP